MKKIDKTRREKERKKERNSIQHHLLSLSHGYSTIHSKKKINFTTKKKKDGKKRKGREEEDPQKNVRT